MNPGVPYDCGCVLTRPEKSRYYAARWKIYINKKVLILRCLDCGRQHQFDLAKIEVQRIVMGEKGNDEIQI